MSALGNVPGAGLLVDGDGVVVDADERCEVVFKCDVAAIRGESLGALRDRGLLDEQSLRAWRRAIAAVQRADSPSEAATDRIVVTPSDGDIGSSYDLRVTPVVGGGVRCSLRSTGVQHRHEEAITALHGATVDQVSAVEGDPLDAAGAPDAFTGAFCAEFAATGDIETALRTGVAAAALARTVEGAVPAFTRAEIDRVIDGIDD